MLISFNLKIKSFSSTFRTEFTKREGHTNGFHYPQNQVKLSGVPGDIIAMVSHQNFSVVIKNSCC